MVSDVQIGVYMNIRQPNLVSAVADNAEIPSPKSFPSLATQNDLYHMVAPVQRIYVTSGT